MGRADLLAFKLRGITVLLLVNQFWITNLHMCSTDFFLHFGQRKTSVTSVTPLIPVQGNFKSFPCGRQEWQEHCFGLRGRGKGGIVGGLVETRQKGCPILSLSFETWSNNWIGSRSIKTPMYVSTATVGLLPLLYSLRQSNVDLLWPFFFFFATRLIPFFLFHVYPIYIRFCSLLFFPQYLILAQSLTNQ